MSRRVRLGFGAWMIIALLVFIAAPATPGAEPAPTPRPDTFDVRVEAVPLLFEIHAPTITPLDILTGQIYSGVSLNSQPLALAQAAPTYAPSVSALPLIGGPWGLVRAVPGAVLGLPSLYGFPPVPIDPDVVPLPEQPPVPIPTPEEPGCYARFPDRPREASCDGADQTIEGEQFSAYHGSVNTGGELADPRSVIGRASAAGARLSISTPPLFSVGHIASAAAAGMQDARMTGGASAAAFDVDVAGVLTIATVRVSVSGAASGIAGAASFARENCVIQGAQFMDQPVTIGPDGVRVAGQGLSAPEISHYQRMLNDALERTGVSVETVPAGPPVIAADGTEVLGDAACLRLTYHIEQSDSIFRVTFGQARLTLNAFQPLVFAPPALGPLPQAPVPLPPVPLPAPAPGALPPPPPPPLPAPANAQPALAGLRPHTGAGWRGAYAGMMAIALAVPLLAALRRFSLRKDT